VPGGGSAAAPSLGTLGVVLAVSFSYLMSWSPYASDYTRYLPSSTPSRRVALYALAGGSGASFAVEMIGALVGSLTSGLGFGGLYGLAGPFGPVAILAIILGAMAANALNIYTNSLSALVLDVKTKRWVAVVVGGLVGLALSFAGQVNFELNFENFLLVLDYWIMPWLGIVLVDYYVSRRTSVQSSTDAQGIDARALIAYLVAVFASVPFMVPALHLGYPFGALAYLFGGADFSYFVSFLAAAGLTFLLRRRMPKGSETPPVSKSKRLAYDRPRQLIPHTFIRISSKTLPCRWRPSSRLTSSRPRSQGKYQRRFLKV
ncbi:MAG TPA: cytosine permease, partial [Nitrososphaerales archaeon]